MLRLFLVPILVAAACGDNGEGSPDARPAGDAGPGSDADVPVDGATTQAITIPFAAEIDGEPFVCGTTYTGIGSTAASIVGADFRFYVHDVAVVTPSGDVPVTLDVNNFQTADGIALLDFETGGAQCQSGSTGTHTSLTGTVPVGTTYTGVKFKIGIPFARNHINATLATAPLNIPAMFWSWAQGFIFLKIDITAGSQGFSVHVGSTGCNGSGSTPPTQACVNPNVMAFELGNFVPGTSTIVADLAPVVADVDVTFNTMNTSQGCMAFPNDPECETVLPKLGLTYGTFPAEPQEFLKVR